MFFSRKVLEAHLATVKSAFPNFTDWQYSNEPNDLYPGFSVWGLYQFFDMDGDSRNYFVTFDMWGEHWEGHLTIGQHSFFWTDADDGDANLIDTTECANLSETIETVKHEIRRLFGAMI